MLYAGLQTLEIHRIVRDEQMIARLIELERKFWRYVETDTPPPADGSPAQNAKLQALFEAPTANDGLIQPPTTGAPTLHFGTLAKEFEERQVRA